MKVAIFFDTPNYTGGIFHQTLNTLNLFHDKDFSDINFEIVTTSNININNFINIKKKIKIFNSHKSAERFNRLTKSRLINEFFKKFKIFNPFEKFIKKNNYDLIFFLSPTNYIKYCGGSNFIVNLFDFNHRIENSFPEYRSDDNIDETDEIILTAVKKAYRIFVNSSQARNDLKEIFACPDQKITLLNYNSNLINIHKEIIKDKNKKKDLENKYLNLGFRKNDNIFFYPAQFWPHKNHKYLIDVAKILEQKKIDFKFIFCGSKKSNYNYVNDQIKLNKLENFIKMFDYLEDLDVISLYLNCNALIMPTYVGRSSLPLIESFYFKKSIFYSEGILDKEIENYVYTFKLDDPNDLAFKIENFIISDPKKINDDKDKAFNFFSKKFNPAESSKIIFNTLNNFRYLMNRWKK